MCMLYVFVYTCVCIYMYLLICRNIYTCVYTYINKCVCIHVCVYIHICTVYIYIYIYIYMYIYYGSQWKYSFMVFNCPAPHKLNNNLKKKQHWTITQIRRGLYFFIMLIFLFLTWKSVAAIPFFVWMWNTIKTWKREGITWYIDNNKTLLYSSGRRLMWWCFVDARVFVLVPVALSYPEVVDVIVATAQGVLEQHRELTLTTLGPRAH